MSLDHNLVLKASKALLTYTENRNEKESENQLLSDENETIYLVIGVKKFSSKARHKPYRIPLRTPVYGEDSEVCIFTKCGDDEYIEKIKDLGLPQIKEVIGMLKLRKEYRPYEARRNLLSSYDIFLTDDRLINSLPEVLGVKFFKKKKLPSPVNLRAKNLKKELQKALSCTYFAPTKGTCTSVRVASTSMSPVQIAENIETAVSSIIEVIPKKWSNIQSISIKTGKSLSLPIFNSLPESAERISAKPGTGPQVVPLNPNASSASAESENEDTSARKVATKKSKKSPLSRTSAKSAKSAKSPKKAGNKK